MESQIPPPKILGVSGHLQASQKIGRTLQTIIPLSLSLVVLLFIDSCKKDSSIANPPPTLTITSVRPLVGKQGDTIIITGTNFNLNPSLDTVKFNGIPARVQKAKSDTLFVIIPSGNCTGTVTVKRDQGTRTCFYRYSSRTWHFRSKTP